MSASKKPSVKKISEITGFSPATVSNALNMKRGVNQETAERIFQVAEELGYSVGRKGPKSIKFVQFRKNGSIIDDNPFHNYLLEGIQAEASRNELDTILIRLNFDDPDYEEQVSRLIMDINGGIILLGTEMNDSDYERFRNCKCPIVIVDGWCRKNWFDGVAINNADSASLVVEYLYRKGHRKIGYIMGEFRIEAFRCRETGYYQKMRELGLEVHPEWLFSVGTTTEMAYKKMLGWLEKMSCQEMPTAFFADNDLIAFGAMKALSEKGFQIPEDISIVGFDDLPYSVVSTPPLTTIRVHKQEMGREAVRRLLTIMERSVTNHYKIEACTDFVERESARTIEIPPQ